MMISHKLKLLASSIAVGAIGYTGWTVITAQVTAELTVIMVQLVYREEKVKHLNLAKF